MSQTSCECLVQFFDKDHWVTNNVLYDIDKSVATRDKWRKMYPDCRWRVMVIRTDISTFEHDQEDED